MGKENHLVTTIFSIICKEQRKFNFILFFVNFHKSCIGSSKIWCKQEKKSN